MFFTGSGSECADTSLKMARAYWRTKGQASKTRFIGREKGYHGVNFGGISVGGIVANRKAYGQSIEADHLPHTMLAGNEFTRGMPATGAELADDLLKLIALHDASNIAAVIVEPFSGSAGVIIPPVGYLQRLREICTANNILLIFDEVITGFGRCGAYTGARGLWRDTRHPEHCQAGHQRHAAAGRGGRQEGDLRHLHGSGRARLHARIRARLHLLGPSGGLRRRRGRARCAGQGRHDLRVKALAPYFEAAVHSLKGSKHVTDIRNYGLAAGLTIAAVPGEPGKRPYQIAMKCLEKGFYVRYGGDTIQLAPPFVIEKAEIDSLINALGESLGQVD